jgi:hypothetical protein
MAAPDSMIAGLFQDPQQYQQAQLQQQMKQNYEIAKLTPEQQVTGGLRTAGYQLGQGLGGMMGAEDPQMKLQSLRKQIMQSIDRNDPKALAEGAQALNQAGDSQGAQALFQAAQARAKDVLEAEVKQSQITKNLRERPERPANLSELGKLQAERADIIAEFGPNDPRVKDYDNKIAKLSTGKSMGQEIGEGINQGLGLIGKALGAGLKKEGEGTGEFAAKDFNALGSAVAAGTASKRNLQTLETALQNSFTGKFADSKESIVASLTALGVPVGDDLKQAASNKQLVDAMGTRYVFPLVKNFPGSLAAKELDRLEKTAPNSLQQPETITRLVNLMKVDLAENEYTYNQAKQYKASKNTTIGFNQADSKIEFQNKLGKLQGMVATARQKNVITKEEKAAIEALKQELGV